MADIKKVVLANDLGIELMKAIGLPDEIINNTTRIRITMKAGGLVQVHIKHDLEEPANKKIISIIKEYEVVKKGTKETMNFAPGCI